MKLFKISTYFLFMILLSCQKTSEETLKDWLGLWSANENGQVYFLEVQEGSQSTYEVAGQSVIYGSVNIDQKKNTLSIKRKIFNIDAYPALNSSLNKYQATLDGLVFTKN